MLCTLIHLRFLFRVNRFTAARLLKQKNLIYEYVYVVVTKLGPRQTVQEPPEPTPPPAQPPPAPARTERYVFH